MSLAYNELKPRVYITLDREPYEVISSRVFRKQQRKPVNQTKIKNLITGKVVERTFAQSETVEEAAISTKPLVYIYSRNEESWFHEAGDPSARFSIPNGVVGEETLRYLKEAMEVEGLIFEGDVIGIHIPVKIALEVTEAPPYVRGNTSQGGTKPVVVETGATVTTPMFIEVGDTIEVNTETGEYVRRVN